MKITPYVQDRKNALLVRFLGDWQPTQLVSVKSAIKRGIEQTKKGVPVLLEFITSKEVTISVPK